jgi:enediyne biosynthesis protein E4
MPTPPIEPTDSDTLPEREEDDAVIGRAFLGSAAVFATIGLVVLGGFLYLRKPPPKVELATQVAVTPTVRELPKVTLPIISWVDITDSGKLNFVHDNGAAGGKLLPETMGSGCAMFDYDGDGDQDILLINSCAWPQNQLADKPLSTIGLFANDGKGNFVNVTTDAGLDVSVFGMGVACGDYDNDGRVDVFISCLGKDRLFHNVNGKFVDVTDQAGVGGADDAWSTSSGWFDYDRDGDLDLLVCHYVQWSREFDSSQEFRLTGSKERAYGRPQNFGGTFPSLFRNDGNGVFADVSESAGFHVLNPATQVPIGKSLGLVFEDFDGDGYLDCVIANDTVQNFMFHNSGDGHFTEVAIESGVAFDAVGAARGAMGVDSAAFRNDSSVGVAVGNFANEMSALYVSRSRNMQFFDQAVTNGFGPATRLELTFGVLFLDFDLDGRLDIFQANGHLEEDIAKVQASQKYEQSPQLFWNAGSEFTTEFIKCREVETGTAFQKPMVGRGSSYGDIDGDGDLDLLIVGCGQKPRLMRNDSSMGHHWLRVKCVGKDGTNRDAIGTLVELRSRDVTQSRRVSPTRGYLSQVELPVTFGLGTADSVDRITITWPDGKSQVMLQPKIDQLLVVEQSE